MNGGPRASRTPVEADFEATDEGAEVAVTFKPTESKYNFLRMAAGGASSKPTIEHQGETGDTDDYDPNEVESLARRVAEQYARKHPA